MKTIALQPSLKAMGFVITGLAISRNQTYVGMFGRVNGGHIRNVGLVSNLADYTGSSDDSISVGGLVGWQSAGNITASYATGKCRWRRWG